MKHIYKLPPCSSYDIEAMESWLSDMATEGLMLTEDGFFFKLAVFARATPKNVRYRLTAAEVQPTLFNDYDSPTDEAVDLSRDMGWEYVCRRGSFYIYRTESVTAPELNSDPEILALTLNKLKKHQRNAFIISLLLMAVYLFLYGVLLNDFHFWISWIALGTPFSLLTILWLVISICSQVLDMVRIGKLRRKLLSEGGLEHKKDYHAGTARYYVCKALKLLVFLLWVILFAQLVGRYVTESDKVILSDYDGAIPFATAQDYVEGEYIESPIFVPNTVRVWSDVLSPVNYDYHEQASIIRNDEVYWEVNYYVDYHEAAFPWLARLLAEDYARYNRDDEYTMLPLPELDVDFACAFADHGVRVVLQKDCVVIHAYFSQYSEYALTPEEWVTILAESIG